MADERPITVPRWALALLTGLASGAVIFAILRFGTGLDLGLSAFFGVSLGLVLAFLVARWFAAAGVVLGAVEVAVSALAAVVSIVAAIVGALS